MGQARNRKKVGTYPKQSKSDPFGGIPFGWEYLDIPLKGTKIEMIELLPADSKGNYLSAYNWKITNSTGYILTSLIDIMHETRDSLMVHAGVLEVDGPNNTKFAIFIAKNLGSRVRGPLSCSLKDVPLSEMNQEMKYFYKWSLENA